MLGVSLIALLVGVVLAAVSVTVVLFQQKLELARTELRGGLEALDKARQEWLDTWHRPLTEARDSLAQEALLSMKVLRAASDVARQDWLWDPSVDLVLQHEWTFEERMDNWVYYQNGLVKDKWNKSHQAYSLARARANQSSLALTRVLTSPLAQVYGYLFPLPTVTLWMTKQDRLLLEQRSVARAQ